MMIEVKIVVISLGIGDLEGGSREPYKMMEMFWILILLVVK